MDAPKASGSTRMAVYYITSGSLLLIWSVIWLLYMGHHPPGSDGTWYLVWGLLFTGLVLTGIGLTIGRIGMSARHADVAAAPTPTSAVPLPGGGVAVTAPNGQMLAPAANVGPMAATPIAAAGTGVGSAVPLSATGNGLSGGGAGDGMPANVPVQHIP